MTRVAPDGSFSYPLLVGMRRDTSACRRTKKPRQRSRSRRSGPSTPCALRGARWFSARGWFARTAGLTVGGVSGPGTFSSLDLGGAVSPIENLELGLSTELTGARPCARGHEPDQRHLLATGELRRHPRLCPLPVRRQRRGPARGRPGARPADQHRLLDDRWPPLRILELFGLFTMDVNLNVRYRNGDKYAAFSPNPSKNTADFTFSGGEHHEHHRQRLHRDRRRRRTRQRRRRHGRQERGGAPLLHRWRLHLRRQSLGGHLCPVRLAPH